MSRSATGCPRAPTREEIARAYLAASARRAALRADDTARAGYAALEDALGWVLHGKVDGHASGSAARAPSRDEIRGARDHALCLGQSKNYEGGFRDLSEHAAAFDWILHGKATSECLRATLGRAGLDRKFETHDPHGRAVDPCPCPDADWSDYDPPCGTCRGLGVDEARSVPNIPGLEWTYCPECRMPKPKTSRAER